MVFSWGLTPDDVQSRIGLLTLSASSEPSQSEVEDWIGEFAGEINPIIAALGENPESYATATDQVKQSAYQAIRGKIARRVAGEVHATNQNGDTSLAERYVAEWNGFVARLASEPSSVLGSGHAIKPKSSWADSEPEAFWKKDMAL